MDKALPSGVIAAKQITELTAEVEIPVAVQIVDFATTGLKTLHKFDIFFRHVMLLKLEAKGKPCGSTTWL